MIETNNLELKKWESTDDVGAFFDALNENFDALDMLYRPSYVDRFVGKTLFVTGDSITEANARATKNWHDYLKDWFGFANVINDGVSGTGLVKAPVAGSGMIDRLWSWPQNADFYIIMASQNDGADPDNRLPLGVFADQIKDASIYGATRYILYNAFARLPNRPIVFLSSIPRYNYYGRTAYYEDYVAAYADMCGHYSVPFLDLYHGSGMRPWNSTYNGTYFSSPLSPSGDGVHPNAAGQKILAQKIAHFIAGAL